MTTTKVYDRDNVYQCCIVKNAQGYEIVFPQDVTLKSKYVNSITSVHRFLDYYFGEGEWGLE
jgi:hypothetical protein